MKTRSQIIFKFVLLWIPTIAFADIEINKDSEKLTPEEEAFLSDFSGLDAINVASEKLNWTDQASKQNYWLKNDLKINPQSLKTGWIEFSQCHYQLDPVPKIEVSYNPAHTRNLKVISYQGIKQIQALNSSVVLINVKRGAQVCIKGESETIKPLKNGFYIQRGPYMRKFLDGYYPMIVEESIELNQIKAKLIKHTPNNPKIKDVALKQNVYKFEYAFEGQLKPYYEFKTY